MIDRWHVLMFATKNSQTNTWLITNQRAAASLKSKVDASLGNNSWLQLPVQWIGHHMQNFTKVRSNFTRLWFFLSLKFTGDSSS